MRKTFDWVRTIFVWGFYSIWFNSNKTLFKFKTAFVALSRETNFVVTSFAFMMKVLHFVVYDRSFWFGRSYGRTFGRSFGRTTASVFLPKLRQNRSFGNSLFEAWFWKVTIKFGLKLKSWRQFSNIIIELAQFWPNSSNYFEFYVWLCMRIWNSRFFNLSFSLPIS